MSVKNIAILGAEEHNGKLTYGIYSLHDRKGINVIFLPSGLGIQHLLLSGPPHFPFTKFPPSHPSLNHLQSPSAASQALSVHEKQCLQNYISQYNIFI